ESDGVLIRLGSVRDCADANVLVMVSIEQLIAYLDERDAAAGAEVPSAPSVATSADPVAATQSLRSTEEVPLPAEHGSLRARAFTIDGHDHLGVFAGSLDP